MQRPGRLPSVIKSPIFQPWPTMSIAGTPWPTLERPSIERLPGTARTQMSTLWCPILASCKCSRWLSFSQL